MREFVERQCVECGEDTYNPERCRDCELERLLGSMHCSGCDRMRYATDAPLGLTEMAASLWGDHCACNPRPPSKWHVEQAAKSVSVAIASLARSAR